MTEYRDNDLIQEMKREILNAIQDSLVPVRYMSLKQAAVYSGIGQKQLITLAKEGKIKGRKVMKLKRADWSFDRESIDKYWHEPFESAQDKAKRIFSQIGRIR
tara:strand:+ start:102 stop:410 length:309 start_codon:yes stop_codon:yes gene_type:complete